MLMSVRNVIVIVVFVGLEVRFLYSMYLMIYMQKVDMVNMKCCCIFQFDFQFLLWLVMV